MCHIHYYLYVYFKLCIYVGQDGAKGVFNHAVQMCPTLISHWHVIYRLTFMCICSFGLCILNKSKRNMTIEIDNGDFFPADVCLRLLCPIRFKHTLYLTVSCCITKLF